MLHRLIETFFSIPAPLAVAVVFLLTACETALFLGLLIPGELAVILGGVLASRDHVSLTGVLVAGIAGPILGDTIGYFGGKTYGSRFFRGRRRKRWARARAWLRKRGAFAVFLGRFTAFLRSVVPAAAGVARIPFRSFFAWDLAAGISWGAGSVLLGYFAGQNFETIARRSTHVGVALLLLVVAGGIYAFVRQRARVRSVRRSRRRRAGN